MADEVAPLDAKGSERAVDDRREARFIGAIEHFCRAAMARQVERDHTPSLGERRLGEHPAVEVGAEAMHQQNRNRLSGAEVEDPQALTLSLDLARRKGTFFRHFR